MPARLTSDQLPAKLRKREVEVLGAKMFRLFVGPRGSWRRCPANVQRQYRAMARLAFTHILGTYRP